MKMTGNKKHAITVLPPLMLAALFGMMALLVLLLSANIYRKTTESASLEEQRYGTLTYIREKIRQAGDDETLVLDTVEGISCLEIFSTRDDKNYVDLIFEKDGQLWELFTRAGKNLTLAGAEPVLQSFGLKMEEIEAGLFRFTTRDQQGTEAFVILGKGGRYGE